MERKMKITSVIVLGIITCSSIIFSQTHDISRESVSNVHWKNNRTEIIPLLHDVLESRQRYGLGHEDSYIQVETEFKTKRNLQTSLERELENSRIYHINSDTDVENLKLKIKNIEVVFVSENIISLYLTEDYSYDYVDPVSFEKIPSAGVTKHFFQVENHNDLWKVTINQVLDYFPLTDPNQYPDLELPAGMEDFGKPITDELLEKLRARPRTFKNKSSNYNREEARRYALKHAKNYNSNYREFDNDCTNFVSQCLKAGGWEYDGGYHRSPKNWYYYTYFQTWTWVNAHYLYWFLQYSNRSEPADGTMSLSVGDLVFADWDFDGHIDHSMIVTHKSRSEIYLSYHTVDRRNYPFKRIGEGLFYMQKITGSN
jgi:hypothetical protein